MNSTKLNMKIQKRRNVKLLTEGIQEHLRTVEIEINAKEKLQILKHFHKNIGHPGAQKTQELIERSYNWRNITREVNDFVGSFIPCLERKNGKFSRNTKSKHFQANGLFEKICLDITGPLPPCKGDRYILDVIDVFSRYVMLIPLKSTGSKQVVIKLFKRWISLFGIPHTIHSGDGSQFSSLFW